MDYVKQDVLCTAFSYPRYIKAMEESTGFSMKDYLSAPCLGWRYFHGLRTKEDDQIYTYIDKYMSYFVRQSISLTNGGRVCSSTILQFKSLWWYFLHLNTRTTCWRKCIWHYRSSYQLWKLSFKKLIRKNMKVTLMFIQK